MKGIKILQWGCLWALLGLGCTDDGVSDSETPSLQISPSRAFRFPKLVEGEASEYQVQLKSVGAGELRITNIQGDFGPEFELYWCLGTGPSPNCTQNVGILEGINHFPEVIPISPESSLFLFLRYVRGAQPFEGGDVSFESNAEGKISLPIQVEETEIEISVTPLSLDFDRVPLQLKQTDKVTITNIGQDPLEIHQLQLNGSVANSEDEQPNGFWVTMGEEEIDPNKEQTILSDPDGDGEKGLSRGKSFEIDVRYQALSEGEDSGTLKIFSNDPAQPEYVVSLTATASNACIQVEPAPIDFGAVLVGRPAQQEFKVMSCGGESLSVEQIYMKEGSSEVFQLDELELPINLPSYDESQDDFFPEKVLNLNFEPTEELPYLGTLVLETNSLNYYGDLEEPGILEVPVQARGTINECPIAAVGQDEYSVSALDIITLDAIPTEWKDTLLYIVGPL